MKILHTADWHLGDRPGRTDDLRRAVELLSLGCLGLWTVIVLLSGFWFVVFDQFLLSPSGLGPLGSWEEDRFAGGIVGAVWSAVDVVCRTLLFAKLTQKEPASQP